MQLTTAGKVKLFAALGAALLTIVANILILEWYQPDLRCEVGDGYISADSAISPLKILNLGHSDADQIRIAANFPRPITEIITGNTINYKVLDGGIGSRSICIEIDRILVNESVYMYFALDSTVSIASEPDKLQIQNITFKGGKGKLNGPIGPIVTNNMLGFLVSFTGLYYSILYMFGIKSNAKRKT